MACETEPMLGKVKWWRHAIVGLAIALMAVLAGIRVIGAGDNALFRPEHFDAKQVTVWPVDEVQSGGDGIRIREVVDIDFGINERRGYQRIIPNDFGVPINIVASSPDAIDDVDAVQVGGETRIRIGDPNITFTGRHRYVLEYELPDAMLSSGQLSLDIIGTDEPLETDRFEVVLTGFEFSETTCDTGSRGNFGGCNLAKDEVGNCDRHRTARARRGDHGRRGHHIFHHTRASTRAVTARTNSRRIPAARLPDLRSRVGRRGRRVLLGPLVRK